MSSVGGYNAGFVVHYRLQPLPIVHLIDSHAPVRPLGARHRHALILVSLSSSLPPLTFRKNGIDDHMPSSLFINRLAAKVSTFLLIFLHPGDIHLHRLQPHLISKGLLTGKNGRALKVGFHYKDGCFFLR